MKVWITKYALSTGIKEAEGEICTGISETMCAYGSETMCAYGEEECQVAHGKDWHKTKEAAIARAEEMRVKKIASLLQDVLNRLEV